MPVTINGSNTPTAGGVTYGDGTQYATTSAGTSGQVLLSAGAGAPTWGTAGTATTATNLAGGSAGTVPYQSAAGTTAMLAAGTSGQVLTSSGAGAPSWTTPSAGAMVYLSTVTASGSSTVDIETTFSSTYTNYLLLISNLRGSNNSASFLCKFKISGSYRTGGYNWHTSRLQSSSTSYGAYSGSGDGYIVLIPYVVTNASDGSAQLAVTISAPSLTTTYKSINCVGGAYQNSLDTSSLVQTFATYKALAGALTGLRFYMDSGTCDGTFSLYGIANS